MASNRQLAAGRHLTSVVASLLTIDAVGTLSLGTSYTLAQRYVNTGNLCASLFYNTTANGDGTTGTPYVKFAIARAGRTFSLYVLMKSYREEYRKNKLVGVLTCSAMDPQAAVSLYA
jgi:hypothetical protein